jgi:hypothetical protein
VVGVEALVLVELREFEEVPMARDTVETVFLLLFLEHSNIMEVEVEVEGWLVTL